MLFSNSHHLYQRCCRPAGGGKSGGPLAAPPSSINWAGTFGAAPRALMGHCTRRSVEPGSAYAHYYLLCGRLPHLALWPTLIPPLLLYTFMYRYAMAGGPRALPEVLCRMGRPMRTVLSADSNDFRTPVRPCTPSSGGLSTLGCAGNESWATFKGRRPSGRGRRLDSAWPGLQLRLRLRLTPSKPPTTSWSSRWADAPAGHQPYRAQARGSARALRGGAYRPVAQGV